MKTKLILIVLISLLIISCEKNDKNSFAIGEGFEIYLTETYYAYNVDMDYSTVDFDSILLSDIPILRYNDLKNYDTITHKLTLCISNDFIKSEDHFLMFVVTINKVPIYCGFINFLPEPPNVLPPPIYWVYIQVPLIDSNNSNNNEIVISFGSTEFPDPRLDRRIVDRLKVDEKIK
jgi:hypothetical protein